MQSNEKVRLIERKKLKSMKIYENGCKSMKMNLKKFRNMQKYAKYATGCKSMHKYAKVNNKV